MIRKKSHFPQEWDRKGILHLRSYEMILLQQGKLVAKIQALIGGYESPTSPSSITQEGNMKPQSFYDQKRGRE